MAWNELSGKGGTRTLAFYIGADDIGYSCATTTQENEKQKQKQDRKQS